MIDFQTDVAPRGLADLPDSDIAAALPGVSDRWFAPLRSVSALRWLSGGGRIVRMRAAAANESLPAELRGACDATLVALTRGDTEIDLRPGSPDREFLAGLVAVGVFTTEAVAELIESVRLLPDPTEGDVAAARAAWEVEQAAAVNRAAYNEATGAALVAFEAGGDWRAAFVAAIGGA